MNRFFTACVTLACVALPVTAAHAQMGFDAWSNYDAANSYLDTEASVYGTTFDSIFSEEGGLYDETTTAIDHGLSYVQAMANDLCEDGTVSSAVMQAMYDYQSASNNLKYAIEEHMTANAAFAAALQDMANENYEAAETAFADAQMNFTSGFNIVAQDLLLLVDDNAAAAAALANGFSSCDPGGGMMP